MISRFYARLTQRLAKLVKVMNSEGADMALKRPVSAEGADVDLETKKLKTDQEGTTTKVKPPKRKKVALLTVYSGSAYHGCQIQTKQPQVVTIESKLVKALFLSDLITQEHVDDMSKMWFQRASRTDKGVSAAGQVFSLLMRTDVEDAVARMNSHLPDDIRALALHSVTKNFDSKNNCSYRTYEYLTPTFAFASPENLTTEEYRISDETLEKLNEIMQNFTGTHNFHNFTSRRKHHDASAKRYIMSFEAGRPFLLDGLQFLVITVRGQSFMLHQIRKMIGLTMAYVRGFASQDTIDLCWGPSKVDIPKAPGLGLLLDKLHYDGYNKKFGSDGIHKPIEWLQYQDEIKKFKMEHIYADIMRREKEDKSMFEWLQTLPLHSYQMYVDVPQRVDQSDDEAVEDEKKSLDSDTNGPKLETTSQTHTDNLGKVSTDTEQVTASTAQP